MVPFETGSKAGANVAAHTQSQLKYTQESYKHVYNLLTEEQKSRFGPHPAPNGILICNLDNCVNDHAGNEKTRIAAIEKAIRLLTTKIWDKGRH